MKISKGTGAETEEYLNQFIHKITIPGYARLYNSGKTVKVSDTHIVFTYEHQCIHNYLVDINKTWDDVEELMYVVGLREPYHQNPEGVCQTRMLASTVDGYEVHIRLKKETEAKYYTPEIEEFRVGFECETLVRGFEKVWSKITLYAEFNKNGWDSNIEDTLIGIDDGFLAVRVKYLDSKDIEELGGIKISDYEYNINGCILQINCSDSTHITISEIRQEWEMTAVPSKTTEYYFPLFVGRVKNKSELKKLLQMLNIE